MDSIIISTEIKNQRDWFDGFGKKYPDRSGIEIYQEYIQGISCYWFIPQHLLSDKTIIYLHGGGYMMGSVISHKAMVSHLADSFYARILFIEYSLAPEQPFPAGVEDVLKVYKSILKQNDALKVLVMGDSAGGGLFLSCLGIMQEHNLPQPAGIIMISPWFDLECRNDSYETNKSIDPIFTRAAIQQYASLYVGQGNISEANPARIILKQYPPSLILVETNEILIDDSRNFIREAEKTQPRSKLSIYKNQSHVWLMSDISTDASQKAIDEMNGFINSLP